MITMRLTKESFILAAVSMVIAFTVNHFSPRGIALMGEWDTSRGVITANAKNDAVHHELEIGLAGTRALHDSGKGVFLDARTSDSFEEGRIAGAVSIPANQFDDLIGEFLEKYPPDTAIITYCSGRTCQDSHIVAQYLKEFDYSNVRVFAGGYPEWDQAGYPVEGKTDENI